MALAYDNDDNKYAKPSSSPPVASSMITQLFWLCYFTSLLTLLVYLLLPLSISTKTASEIDLMRRSCRDASSLLSSLSPFLIPDHTTLSVDAAATKLVNIMGVTAAPLGYGGIVGEWAPDLWPESAIRERVGPGSAVRSRFARASLAQPVLNMYSLLSPSKVTRCRLLCAKQSTP